jgi:hypothetical protein
LSHPTKGAHCHLQKDFDASPDYVVQRIALFTQSSKETVVMEDFIFLIKNSSPSVIVMFGTNELTTWLIDTLLFTIDNIPIDPSQRTIEKLQDARVTIQNHFKSLSSPTDPKKHP